MLGIRCRCLIDILDAANSLHLTNGSHDVSQARRGTSVLLVDLGEERRAAVAVRLGLRRDCVGLAVGHLLHLDVDVVLLGGARHARLGARHLAACNQRLRGGGHLYFGNLVMVRMLRLEWFALEGGRF